MKVITGKLGVGCLAAISLLTVSAGATGLNSCDNCCRPYFSHGRWEVGAAAIYQQTCVQNYGVAVDRIVQGTVESDQIYDVNPQAYWGFKVWLGWYACNGCSFADVLYKRLHSYHDGKTFSNFAPGNVLVNQIAGVAADSVIHAKQGTRFDTVRVRYGMNPSCCRSVGSFFAGRYVGAEIKRTIFVPSPGTEGNHVHERTRFDGGGIEFGVDAQYPVGCGFDLVGLLGGIALFGNRTDSFDIVRLSGVGNGATARVINGRHLTKCVPGFETNIGVSYGYNLRLCGCCLYLIGEVGWEMDYFFNILALRPDDYYGEGFAQSNGQPTNFGTSGLYIALSAGF